MYKLFRAFGWTVHARHASLVGVLILLANATNAAADGSCDCSVKKGPCLANASIRGNFIVFKAGTQQCAQITYSVEGDPDSITIKGGSGSIDLMSTKPNPHVDVDSCTVCASGDEGQTRNSTDDDEKLAAILKRAQEKAVDDAVVAAQLAKLRHGERAIQAKIAKQNDKELQQKIQASIQAAERNRQRQQQEQVGSDNNGEAIMNGVLGALAGAAGAYSSGMQSGSSGGENYRRPPPPKATVGTTGGGYACSGPSACTTK